MLKLTTSRSLGNMIERMSQMQEWFSNFESEARVACQPEDGIYTVYEMKPVSYQIEVNGSGDIIHRRLSEEEVEIIKSNKEVEGNK
jgi:hypothetical protein